MSNILTLKDVTAGYSGPDVIHSINITVNKGDFVTVIGGNGAGKTTTLMTISRFLKLRSGKISFDSQEISCFEPFQLTELGMAHVPEGRKIFPRLTVRENLELGAYTRKDHLSLNSDFEMIHELFPILADRSTQIAGTLSGGEQQMLAIGRALMAKPKMLLLDEPSMGVAPLLVEKIFTTLQSLHKNGMTILLVEQNALLAMKLANYVYVLEGGKVTLSGPSSDLINDPRVKQAYLGGI